jgi:hypothetical protein
MVSLIFLAHQRRLKNSECGNLIAKAARLERAAHMHIPDHPDFCAK